MSETQRKRRKRSRLPADPVPLMRFNLLHVASRDIRALILFARERKRVSTLQAALLQLLRDHPLYPEACAAYGIEPVTSAAQIA